MKYEYFCDESYFHQWCVRPVGERRWGHGWHVNSEAEAKSLAEHLEKVEAKAEYEQQLAEARKALVALNDWASNICADSDISDVTQYCAIKAMHVTALSAARKAQEGGVL